MMFYIIVGKAVCRKSDMADCSPHAECIIAEEGPTCKCLKGYVGNGITCNGK